MALVSVVNFQSLDGVIQSVLSPDEDREGGFSQGGWVLPYTDETVADFMQRQTVAAGGLLLGRKTYEAFAAVWPYADQTVSSGKSRATSTVNVPTASTPTSSNPTADHASRRMPVARATVATMYTTPATADSR